MNKHVYSMSSLGFVIGMPDLFIKTDENCEFKQAQVL